MTTKALKIALLSSLGAGLEYYDFIIYGMMAEQLSSLFFAGDEPWLGLIKIFAIFAVGYFARPLGGIFFGLIGDTFGRKKSFLTVMLLMATATFGIGLLPTYAQIGALAPCLLMILRLLQGISVGAELPGAITVVCEHAQEQKHGIYSAIVMSGTSFGALFASLVLYLLSSLTDQAQIMQWGWRLPFLFGGSLAIVNYYLRRHLMETPEFSQIQIKRTSQALLKEPLVCLMCDYWPQLIAGIGLTLFVSSLVIGGLYLPTHLNVYFAYSLSDSYLAIIGGMLWSAIALPICGYLADHTDKRKLFLLIIFIFLACLYPLFTLLEQHSFAALLTFMVAYQTIIAFTTSYYFPLLAALFPTKIRFTGIAASYNIAYSIIATLPIFVTTLIHYSGNPNCFIWILMASALITGVSTLCNKSEGFYRIPV